MSEPAPAPARQPVTPKRPGAGEAWALLSAFSYALTYLLSSVALRDANLDYMFAVALRALPVCALSATMMVLGARRKAGAIPAAGTGLLWERSSVLAMVISGLLTFVVGNPLLLAALRAGGVLIATPMIGTQTLWSALLAAALLGEALNVQMALAMMISLVGVVVLTVGKTAQLALQPGWWMAVPLAAGAALCWALGGVLSARAMRRGINRYQAVFISSLTAVLALSTYLLVSGTLPSYWTTSLAARLGMLLAGVFNGVALVSLTSAIAQTSVASATTLYSLQIALSPLLAWLVLKEPLNLWMAAGILIITAGVIGVQRARA